MPEVAALVRVENRVATEAADVKLVAHRKNSHSKRKTKPDILYHIILRMQLFYLSIKKHRLYGVF